MSLCQCGCGAPAPLAAVTDARAGHRKGDPQRFVAGHQFRGPRPARRQTPSKALARNVPTGPPGDCWPWRGTRNDEGYGVVTIGGRQRRAHCLAYEAAKGPVPPGLVVRHACDNPPCVNPAHLLVGTNQDNVDDRTRRGRQPRGEGAYQARLTGGAVLEARGRRARGESIAALAREFGVSESALAHAIKGRTWKHLGESA